MKNFEIEKKSKISKFSKIFIENCMKMKKIEIENFRKIFDLKIFQGSTLSCSNFLSNQSFLIFFFMDRCKIARWFRWNRLERPKMHSEEDKRKSDTRV